MIRKGRIYNFYYLFIGLYLSIIAGAALICFQIITNSQSSHLSHKQWSSRVESYEELGILITKANRPGNLVFKDLDVNNHRKNLDSLFEKLEISLGRIDRDIRGTWS